MKKSIRMLIAGFITAAVALSCAAAPASAASGNNVMIKTDSRTDELIEAVELGFGSSLYDTETITYKAYYALLGKLISCVYPNNEEKAAQWNDLYPIARDYTDPIDRINAMYLLYSVAYDVLGKDYANLYNRWPGTDKLSWRALNKYMGDGVWDTVYPSDKPSLFKYEWYEGQNEYIDFNCDGKTDNDNDNDFRKITASYYFSFGQTACNGHTMFDYDKKSNSMRVADKLTVQEAMLSAVRLYHVVDRFDQQTNFVSVSDNAALHYRTDIITPELLSRAQYLPTPTYDALPYYTGIQQDWITFSDGSYLSEASFRLYAELGMNFVRVNLTCKNFFGIGDEVDSVNDVCTYVAGDKKTYYAIGTDAESAKSGAATAVTEVDTACLSKLDEVISWGLKYGLHICVQFDDYPGHIQYLLEDGSTADSDFFVSAVKQEQTATLWETIAARYKGIPSSVLSFAANHEPSNPGRTTSARVPVPTDAQVEAGCKRIVDAITAADPDRFQFYETMYDQCVDDFMADAGVAQTSYYTPTEYCYWNLITDAAYSGGIFPAWPFYCLPNVLDNSRRTLTVNGFLPAGTSFTITPSSIDTADGGTTFTVTDSDGNTLFSQTYTTAQPISFRLESEETKLTLGINENHYIVLGKFIVTLPKSYEKPQWQTAGDTQSGFTREQVKSSVLQVPIAMNGDKAFKGLYDKSREDAPERAWLLNADAAAADLTITKLGANNACSFSTKYGYNEASLQALANQYAAQRQSNKVQGMNFELAAVWYHTEDDMCAYYEDLLSAFQEWNIGWTLYDYHSLFMPFYAGAETAPTDDGIFMDTRLIGILKKHAAERPVIYAELPLLSAQLTNGTIRADVFNPDAEQGSFALISASYDSGGKLLGTTMETVALSAGERKSISITPSLPAQTAALKLFYLRADDSPLASDTWTAESLRTA